MTVTTFNVLAPCYKRIKGLDGTVTMEAEDMTTALDRQTRVLDMLTSSGSAIICLQEFWQDKTLKGFNPPTFGSAL